MDLVQHVVFFVGGGLVLVQLVKDIFTLDLHMACTACARPFTGPFEGNILCIVEHNTG